MSNPGWKQYERRIARLFGVERKGILGGEDFGHKFLSGETKLLKKLPKWLTSLYKQANSNCPIGKHPIVIVKEKNKKDDDSFVIMRLKNFLSCFIKKKEK